VAVQVNHENDAQIKELFEKIEKEQDGKLDILVNNAYKAVTVSVGSFSIVRLWNLQFYFIFKSIFDNSRVKFWEQPPEIWDDVNNVGLRYID
jgi:dehydrogenase/reductase SDR family protein 1